MRALLCLSVAAVVLCACVQKIKVDWPKEPSSILIWHVDDSKERGTQMALNKKSEPLWSELRGIVGTRNLDPRSFDFQADHLPLLSQQRMQALTDKSQKIGAPWAILIETEARFFSQMQGRYRWSVATKITAKGPYNQQTETGSVEIPVWLVRENDGPEDAIEAAAQDIAKKMARILDTLQASAPIKTLSNVQSPLFGPLYFTLIDRYANGDPSNDKDVDLKDPEAWHGGDLKGIQNHISDIENLGSQAVWVSPFYKGRTEKFFNHGAFHGYWVYNHLETEPRMGTFLEARELGEALHQRKMKLFVDWVVNHVGPDAPMVKKKPNGFITAVQFRTLTTKLS